METINIQIKELENCANLSLENAEQYIKDAELLIENSSFGHAYAFGVWAYEEIMDKLFIRGSMVGALGKVHQ